MTTDVQSARGGTLERATGTGLADVLDTILDKGIVIDAYVQASVVGINILEINARVVVASVDTYLRFAEAVNRLDLSQSKGQGIGEIVNDVQQVGAKNKAKGIGSAATSALESAGEKLRDVLPGSDDDDREDREEVPSRAKGKGD